MVADFRSLPDLAGRVLGASVVFSDDEFYAPAQNLIAPYPATHDPLKFDIRGKVYDGWETRRRRAPGTDTAIIRLAAGAVVHGVNVDTSHFRGNYPLAASVEATTVLGYPSVAELLNADWQTLIEPTDLDGDSANVIEVEQTPQLVTHLRLRIHPDGGVARFRAFGEVVPDPRLLGGRVDLAATLHGGRILDCSNMFYAAPANVLAPGRAAVMSDGWETARRRIEGNEWLSVTLGAPGRLHNVVIDTSRFVGNSPGWACLTDADSGTELLPRTALLPDTEHRFRLCGDAPVSAVRLDILPDGGISRLRMNGEVDPAARADIADRWLSLLPAQVAAGVDPSEFFD